MHCDDEEGWLGLRVSLFSLSFASPAKCAPAQREHIRYVSESYVYAFSILGSDIVQWMMKNLDIEDQGKSQTLKCLLLVYV